MQVQPDWDTLPFDPAVCHDYSLFKLPTHGESIGILKESRRLDDTINLRLNGLPRSDVRGDTCRDLAAKYARVYALRDTWITGCLQEYTRTAAAAARTLAERDPSSLPLTNAVSEAERLERLARNELQVESILRATNDAILRRRCMLTVPKLASSSDRRLAHPAVPAAAEHQ